MARSEAYARIKRDVYAIAKSLPAGRLTTNAAIGAFLDVAPRQVAYLLALRNDEAREEVPWFRVVGDDGSLGRPKHDAFGRSQAELLAADGVAVDGGGRVVDLGSRLMPLTIARTGVRPTPRPAAPKR